VGGTAYLSSGCIPGNINSSQHCDSHHNCNCHGYCYRYIHDCSDNVNRDGNSYIYVYGDCHIDSAASINENPLHA
jgi:hypothetical protein